MLVSWILRRALWQAFEADRYADRALHSKGEIYNLD